MPYNASGYQIYYENINSQSNLREYLIQFMNNLAITTPNSIKSQSSTLVELTQATNQLTRQTLVNKSIQRFCSYFRLALIVAIGTG